MNETWKPVLGHPGYEVSDLGRVRSNRQVNCQGRILRPGVSSKGHLRLALFPTGKQRAVHQLVLEAFVGPRPEGMLGLHRDGNPENNHVENLYWGTYSENLRDSVRHGTHPQAKRAECKYGHPIDGVRKNGARYCRTCNKEQVRAWKQAHPAPSPPRPPLLSTEQIAAIKADTRPLRRVGADYGISHTTVRKVQRGLYG